MERLLVLVTIAICAIVLMATSPIIGLVVIGGAGLLYMAKDEEK